MTNDWKLKQALLILKNTFEGQVEVIGEKGKKFGVRRYNPQNTADHRYPLPPCRVKPSWIMNFQAAAVSGEHKLKI